MSDRIALFPLRTVLFPGMPLPLHVFEERYRLMMSRCIDAGAAFGVVLIRSGEEVGGPAEPHAVGTTARVARVQRLPDGRMNVIAVGERRFRILSTDESEPYLQGDVEYVDDIDGETPEAEDLAGGVSALFGEQYRLLMAITGQWARAVDLPSEPGRLADFVAHSIEAEALVKQALLEELSVPRRLLRLSELVGERIRALTERWEEERRKKFAGAALN